MSAIYETAQEAYQHGVSVIPIGPRKVPIGRWKQRQATRANVNEIRGWFATERPPGLGVVTGKVSGNLEMLEFEGRAVAEGLIDDLGAIASPSMRDLLHRLFAGYAELTPKGGYHTFYYLPQGEPVPRNTVLAARPPTTEERQADPDVKKMGLIETRGEGGYSVVAPSNGQVHPEGGSWILKAGGFGSIATVSAAERAELHALLRTFDKMPAKTYQPKPSAGPVGDRPGDRYNAAPEAQERTLEILLRHGWSEAYRRGSAIYLTRPGKAEGVSATLGYVAPGVLYVFSTSVAEFESETAYLPFTVYAILEHDRDWTAAAKALPRISIVASESAPAIGEAPDLKLLVNVATYCANVPDDVPWAAKPVAYFGGVSLWAGIWKGGKSTLAAQLQRARETGEAFLGWPVPIGRTVLVTEEGGVPVKHKVGKLQQLDILDRKSAVMAGLDFDGVCALLRAYCSAQATRAVIFIDTFAVWGDLEDENDAPEVTAAISKLTILAQETGCAIVLVHHNRKDGGAHGRGIRGSGAIPATVDIFATLDRLDDKTTSTDRILKVEGRVIEPTVMHLLFDLETKTYTAKNEDEALRDELEDWLAKVPPDGDGLAYTELTDTWGISRGSTYARVETLLKLGRLRQARGKRGNATAQLHWSIPSVWLDPADRRNGDPADED